MAEAITLEIKCRDLEEVTEAINHMQNMIEWFADDKFGSIGGCPLLVGYGCMSGEPCEQTENQCRECWIKLAHREGNK